MAETEIPAVEAPAAEAPAPKSQKPTDLPHLKRLLIAGFKSFAQPVEFEFLPGITGIVGPNGCGKSNVVDAIRWVLGEQSPKSLRGAEMQDVIFNGAEGEAALGYAEVTLTFSNCRGTLSPEFDEVAVGRRLYRSGESEYFLNQQACRLKDVRELFMGTGAGMEAYSIVEQGKVDALLTSNTQDRRAVFDEVAGISLYRVRVRQAQSKLERVTQDLARVEDMVKEVDARLTTIRRQARKAELYRAKTQRLATLRLSINRHRHAQFIKEITEIGAQVEESAKRVAEASAERERLEADRAKAEAELARLDERRMALHGEILTAEGNLTLLEKERYLAETRRKELEQEARAQASRAEAARARMESLAAEAARAGEALVAARAALEEVARRAVATGKALEEAQARFASHRDRVAEFEQARATASRRLEEARARATVLGERRQALESQHAGAAEATARVEKASRIAHGRLASSRAVREGAQAVLHQVERDAEAAQSALAAAQAEASGAREALGRLEARSAALAEAQGASAPALDIAALRAGGISIRGVLSSLLEAAPADLAMLEAALGELGRALVVDTWDDAADVLAQAAERGIPVSCLVLEAARPEAAPVAHALADRVHCDPAIKPLVRALLGGVDVVAKLPATPRGALATSGGDFANGVGIVRHAAPGSTAILSVSDLPAASQTARDALQAAERAVQGKSQVAARLRETLVKVRAELERAAAAESEAQRAAGDAEASARLASERTEALAAETESAGAAADTALRESEALSALPTPDAPALEAVPGAPSPEELASALDRAREADAAARVEQARCEGERVRAESALREAEGVLARAGEERTEAQRLATQAGESASSLAGEAEGREASRRETEARAAQGREAMAALESEAREASGRQRAAIQTHREMAEVVRRLEENHQGFIVRRSEVEARRASLQEQCRENFGWSEAEVAQPPEESVHDLEPLLKEAESLDEQIRRMGLVNLEALEEEGELDQRLKGLTGSRDDLNQAGASLQELIKELDARSEAQFLQVFEEVKLNFQELFRRLFGGGRADILLEDPTRVLDSGIEIIARPPGREPLSISLLSGGQKALSAVALIFAFFRSRPSPFYILDEVDAPLDESNIDRFLGLLQEFAKVSQFLIITHNRRTMRTAGTLYGVTMQRPGISTRMGVRFEDLKN